MSETDPSSNPQGEAFVPVAMYGFAHGKVLQQAWVGTLGTVEWRDIEPVDTGCVVGHIDMEDEDGPDA